MEFTLGEDSEKPSKKELSGEEVGKQLDRLIKDKANNQRIHDWVEVSAHNLTWNDFEQWVWSSMHTLV